MAEIAGMLAAAVLKMAAGKVAEAVGDRLMLQGRFGEDLEGMQGTMRSIQAVLKDAEGKSIKDEVVRLWLERLTDASYDISDMFDEFEVDTTSKSALRKFKVLNPCITLASEVRMTAKTRTIRMKLQNISNECQNYNFMTSSSSNDQQIINDRATSSSEVIEAEVLGRDQEKQIIIALLTRPTTSSELIILPIYGIGGIGKTTLAQLLFNDIHFKDYEKAWVYVSQAFDLSKIKETVRSELQLEQGQVASTQEQAAGSSAPKSILIVLDDVWEKDDFKLDELKKFLKIIRKGHKVHVIVTTRDAGIAQKIQTIEAHKIEALSLKVCWTIIKQIVGFEERSDKERLKDIGKEIAKRCGGVALAARALGYLLKSRDFDGWVSVKSSGLWNVSSSGYTTSPYHNVLASLKLSYSSMPPHLRLCFAYCAVFPKGHNMAKDELIYQWAALGFIKPSDEFPTWQQHGENSMNQLLGMSFFQHSKSPSIDGKYSKDVQLFTMHDLVHDLARSIMGDALLDASEGKKIRGRNCRYTLLEDCSKPLNSVVTYPDKIRALRFLVSGQTGHCHDATHSENTRALCFMGSDGIRSCPVGFSTAKYLRVLDLAECSLKKLPATIGQLKLLKYLNAPGIEDQVIPSCITRLSKLIYLSLRGSSAVLALPESIGEMDDMMYIDLSGCSGIEKLPESLGKLKNLVHVDFSNCSHVGHLPESFGNLTQLQFLNLSGCRELKDLPESFGNLTQLQFLNLSGCGSLTELPESFGKLESLIHLDLSYCLQVNDVPKALCSLTKLQYLNLSKDRKNRSVKPSLKGLPKAIRKLIELRYLNVSAIASMEEGEMYFHDFFDSVSTLSNLEHLDLSSNSSFWTIPDSFCSLRKLHTLDLGHCNGLRLLPGNISCMDSLKVLNVHGCNFLNKSDLPINKNLISLPNFVVHDSEGERSSNLVLLKDVNPPKLEISGLENVKSIEEARIIELREKEMMAELTLDWTRGRKGFVEDMELLGELMPPSTLEFFELRGYNSVSFPPAWLLVGADIYLPNLTCVELKDLPQCTSLPPLGRLPNLKGLHLEAMPSISRIDRSICGNGDVKAFGQLEVLRIFDMENLEEWTTTCSYGEGAVEEFMFPNLKNLTTFRCRKLRVDPCPPRVKEIWKIEDSDGVLLQRGESVGSTISALVDTLEVNSCTTPTHHWKLLHRIPTLKALIIDGCSEITAELPQWLGDLTSLRSLVLRDWWGIQALPERLGNLTSLRSLVLRGWWGIQTLPEQLGDLTSLRSLELHHCSGIKALPRLLGNLVSLEGLGIYYCEGIMSLPESIKQLTNLQSLTVEGCSELTKWCQLEENSTKIDHIPEKRFRERRSQPKGASGSSLL